MDTPGVAAHIVLAVLALCQGGWLAVLATFVAGIALGDRRGYARGLKDGNPFPRLRVGSPCWNWLAMVFGEYTEKQFSAQPTE